jgi:hypothetical protein
MRRLKHLRAQPHKKQVQAMQRLLAINHTTTEEASASYAAAQASASTTAQEASASHVAAQASASTTADSEKPMQAMRWFKHLRAQPPKKQVQAVQKKVNLRFALPWYVFAY